ncbi:FAD-binding oxidoreductase [Acidisoma silvae]|uniref:FAD-binding oxidoreductase n=1 Tax=Acidisoma silvae TaxID=2802396 RepID=A0A963YY06_9PROT|nr:FAD-binding oxidoreductase [Acidisoma silvae]MCB8878382.1 FAD-binding oxidoreductase [Acidisoma silvae]
MLPPSFHETQALRSWGRVTQPRQFVQKPAWLNQAAAAVTALDHDGSVLPVGLGRSYGDTALNPDGGVVVTSALDRLIDFDAATGVIHAEAGISLGSLLAFLIPRGFFLPVTPGSQFVTLGGAIANDVHGKNHHEAGTFGCWVEEITLARSDGTIQQLQPGRNDGFFAATIGGLGLTGMILSARFKAIPIRSSLVETETIPFANLAEFFAIAQESETSWPYTVSWIDCFGSRGAGRGLFSRARHVLSGELRAEADATRVSIPFEAPGILLSKPVLQAFNALYYTAGKRHRGTRKTSYKPFFYPLDAIGQWNLLYGRQGLYQYQSVVPPAAGPEATAEMLRQIAAAGQGSFLAVLKTFGPRPSPGMLSFPQEGTTLALDFPNRGESTLALLARLDDIVRAAGGRLYPAKDGRMSGDLFRAGYPRLAEFEPHVDPKFSSAFWRRVKTAG